MAEFDLSEYLGVFLDEVDEQLQVLDSEILNLEKDPTNIETIQNIFRAAHTLKGSSASMGYEQMKEYTHHLENIFDQIRNSKMDVTPELIDVIFESIDFLKKMKDAIITETLETLEIGPNVEILKSFINNQLSPKHTNTQIQEIPHLDQHQKNKVLNGVVVGHNALKISIQFADDTLMKGVRALIIHNHLKEVGEVVAAFPSVEEMEKEEEFQVDFTFILLSMQTNQEILEMLSNHSDIESVNLETLTEENMNVNVSADGSEIVTRSSNQTSESDSKDKSVEQKTKINPTVRVDVDKLEHLMNLVGELVIDQTRLVDVKGRLTGAISKQEEDLDVLDEVTNHISRVISELQDGMMKTRMLPIEQLFNRFPRMVRDTAQKAKKEIEFLMYGKETELDRTLIEEIFDPIIHLLRNSIDHGIESADERERIGKPRKGKVELRAAHEENQIVISIKDDGKGIAPEKIKLTAIKKGLITEEEASKLTDKDAMYLIFKSGFSTAEKITDISGRGVGMDIVRAHIEKLNGIIDIDSTIGVGTTFSIKLPLTLAIISSLLVKFGNKTFAIPLINVLEIIHLNKDDIQMINNQEVGVVRDRVLPLVRMKERLGCEDNRTSSEMKKREFVIVVGIADKRIGLIADKTIGNQEIVIKSLGSYIGSPPYIAGATIMGDGSVALILDISSIVRDEGTLELENSDAIKDKLLEEERQFVTFKLNHEEYGIEVGHVKDIVTVPKITKVANTREDLLGIMNLRGRMIPVVDLRKRFNLDVAKNTRNSRIIVVEEQLQDVGFLVDEVTQVLKTSNHLIENLEDSRFNLSKLIKGFCKLDDRVVMLLELTRILNTDDQLTEEITSAMREIGLHNLQETSGYL